MKKWWNAASRAMGVRKYIVFASATGVPVAYGWFSSHASAALSLHLPQVPWLSLALLAGMALLGFWFLQRLVSLEEELEPRLDIEFVNSHPFSILDPGLTGTPMRFLRIRVTNRCTRTLNSCIVKLEEFYDKDGKAGFFVPIALITQHQLWQQREGGPFALRGKETKYIEVAAMSEPSTNGAILLQYETNTAKPPNGVRYPNTVPASNGPYTLRLTAFGGGAPTSQSYRLDVDEQGRLRMQLIAESEMSKRVENG